MNKMLGPQRDSRTAWLGKILALLLFGFQSLPAQFMVSEVTAGGAHSLALGTSGQVWAWGSNSQGQVGNGTTSNQLSPVRVSGLCSASSLGAGNSHSLAVIEDGTVRSWGDNQFGQLGDGTAIDRFTPVTVGGAAPLTNIISVAGGGAHSLALKRDGTVWAWGSNSLGQLGDGTVSDRFIPVPVTGLSSVVAIDAGDVHSLALKSDGTVWAWGSNTAGQLGNGTFNPTAAIVQVVGLTNVIAIAAGGGHNLALRSDGTVWAWGYGGWGQLGEGLNLSRASIVRAGNLTSIASIAAGGNHSLAVQGDGTVWVWGQNQSGQLGDGTLTTRATPVASGFDDIAHASGGVTHTLAINDAGFVLASGSADSGRLGNGANSGTVTTPVIPQALPSGAACPVLLDRRTDLNRDGHADLVWQNDFSRRATVNYYGGAQGATWLDGTFLVNTDQPGWTIVGADDFDRDGRPDLVWQNDVSRRVTVNYYWGPNGNQWRGGNWLLSADQPGWRVVGIGDFNLDGHPDLVWQNDISRRVTVNYYGGPDGDKWLGGNWLLPVDQPGWKVVGVGDFNADGHPDLVWQNDTSRHVTVNYYGGPAGDQWLGGNWLLTTDQPGWKVVGVGDFNRDRQPDLVWQNETSRQVTVNYYGGGDGNQWLGGNWLLNVDQPNWAIVAP